MKIRRITSLTATLSFVLMIVTSIILYIVPQGRVAYWADWHLWGLTKTDWGNIHIVVGFLFLFTLMLHIYYNWKPLINYLKNKAKEIRVFTPEFSIALILTIVTAMGTYLNVLPFSWVLSLNEYFKDSGTAKYGEPPYGHAELSSLKTFAKKMNLDLDRSVKLLNQAGYGVNDGTVTLAAIGKQYNIPPQRVYETIKPAEIAPSEKSGPRVILPESPQPGTGSLTLADFCAQFNLNGKMVVRELNKRGIKASMDLTLKHIATQNQTSPSDLYEAIKDIVQN